MGGFTGTILVGALATSEATGGAFTASIQQVCIQVPALSFPPGELPSFLLQ